MNRKKPCDRCCPTRNKLPIVVTVTRVEKDDGKCGKPCHVHANGIDRFPDASDGPPTNKVYETECENCQKIIKEKDLQIYEKEQEMMKLMTNLITLPKSDKDDEGDVQHDYKGLRDIEAELLKRDQELARMKMEACDDVCYNALRKKQLELRWKDFELERRRPNIIKRSLKTLKNKVAEAKEHNCFEALQKKERELKEREERIDEQIEKLREKRYKEEMAYLQEELEFRRRPFEFDANTDCSCDCATINEIQEKEKKRQEKYARDACIFLPIGAYVPFWTSDTMEQINRARLCLAEEYAKYY